MHKFHHNFKTSVRDRASQISARAYNHYLRFRPFIGKISQPLRTLHQKYVPWKKGKSS